MHLLTIIFTIQKETKQKNKKTKKMALPDGKPEFVDTFPIDTATDDYNALEAEAKKSLKQATDWLEKSQKSLNQIKKLKKKIKQKLVPTPAPEPAPAPAPEAEADSEEGEEGEPKLKEQPDFQPPTSEKVNKPKKKKKKHDPRRKKIRYTINHPVHEEPQKKKRKRKLPPAEELEACTLPDIKKEKKKPVQRRKKQKKEIKKEKEIEDDADDGDDVGSSEEKREDTENDDDAIDAKVDDDDDNVEVDDDDVDDDEDVDDEEDIYDEKCWSKKIKKSLLKRRTKVFNTRMNEVVDTGKMKDFLLHVVVDMAKYDAAYAELISTWKEDQTDVQSRTQLSARIKKYCIYDNPNYWRAFKAFLKKF